MSAALYQKAVGYNYDAVKIFMPAGAKKPIYAPYVEHVPPSDVAMIFWLKNRDPANWRDAWQIENVTGKYVISDQPMDEEQLDQGARGGDRRLRRPTSRRRSRTNSLSPMLSREQRQIEEVIELQLLL